MPVIGLEALAHIFAEGQTGIALDRNMVIIVEVDKFAELEKTSHGSGLRGDAFHQIAIAGNGVDIMIDNSVIRAVVAISQEALGNCHTDAVSKTLTERAGSGFYASRMTMLGMARCEAAPLAELLELLQREIVASEIEHAIQKHRGVSGREDKAVAVAPGRVARIIVHKARPEQMGKGSQGHCGTGMTGIGLLYRVHCQGADRIDTEFFECIFSYRCLLLRCHQASNTCRFIVQGTLTMIYHTTNCTDYTNSPGITGL